MSFLTNWRISVPVIVVVLAAIGFFAFSGGSGGGGDRISEPLQGDPEGLDHKITMVAYSTLEGTKAALEDFPPHEEALPMVKLMKDSAIEELQALGQEVAALDMDAQKALYSNVSQRMMLVEIEEPYASTFSEVQGRRDSYGEGKLPQLYEDLDALGIIWNHAFAGIAKEMNPGDAARLGL